MGGRAAEYSGPRELDAVAGANRNDLKRVPDTLHSMSVTPLQIESDTE